MARMEGWQSISCLSMEEPDLPELRTMKLQFMEGIHRKKVLIHARMVHKTFQDISGALAMCRSRATRTTRDPGIACDRDKSSFPLMPNYSPTHGKYIKRK